MKFSPSHSATIRSCGRHATHSMPLTLLLWWPWKVKKKNIGQKVSLAEWLQDSEPVSSYGAVFFPDRHVIHEACLSSTMIWHWTDLAQWKWPKSSVSSRTSTWGSESKISSISVYEHPFLRLKVLNKKHRSVSSTFRPFPSAIHAACLILTLRWHWKLTILKVAKKAIHTKALFECKTKIFYKKKQTRFGSEL